MRFLLPLALLGSILGGILGAASVRADEDADHDRVRRALARGELQPLSAILDAVRPRLPGDLVGVEIERRKERWFYEFRVVGADGRVYEVRVDAKSAEIERIKEK
ncbi:MAG: PepSY domain-containing protein [Alphaproteobacteria bacterium]|nr:PepSY domain-containing protein [Alphaproteobacteria bacterium]